MASPILPPHHQERLDSRMMKALVRNALVKMHARNDLMNEWVREAVMEIAFQKTMDATMNSVIETEMSKEVTNKSRE